MLTRKKMAKRQIIPRQDHTISRANISENALRVLYRLKKAKFDAYLVGGCVRDLLLGKKPKDFDVATNAHPEQVRKLFKNCRLIGRRFRLAHIYFGREIIEVATFRANASDPADKHQHISGLLLRDNVYGTLEDDVWRRDFTMNALYYNIADFSLTDYCNGLKDLNHGIVRIIGEPQKRYYEDPVRMLRAIRFASKLDFKLDPETAEPIKELGWLLEHVAPARLFEEILKLFLTGHALKSYQALAEYKLLDRLFPDLIDVTTGEVPLISQTLIQKALHDIDQRIHHGKTVSPSFLFAAFLWHLYQKQMKVLKNAGLKEASSSEQAIEIILAKQAQYTAIPKRCTAGMREIWTLQIAMSKRRPRQLDFIVAHRRFRAAYDFMLLRSVTEEEAKEISQWWTDYQHADEVTQKQMAEAISLAMPKKNKPYRSRKKTSVSNKTEPK